MAAATSSRTDSRIALPWIFRLRHAMAGGQLLTCLLVDQFLGINLPLRWLLWPPVIVILSNLWLSRRESSAAGDSLIGWIFVLDTFCLTAALMLAGGPYNPFSLLYLVHVTLAATILDQRQTWGLGALACVCFALLFWNPWPIAALELHQHGGGVNLHLTGMWIAFALAAALVAIFSGRISELLRQREQSLLRMQEELAKKDRLASLVTLAAGAAHELSTPLGTIAVVARELERYATLTTPDSAIAQDCRLIRAEVERCSGILRRMSVASAEPAGEALAEVAAAALLDTLRAEFPGRLSILASPDMCATRLRIPPHAVEQALIALIKNGLEAGSANQPVSLHVTSAHDFLRFQVVDSGSGMPPDVLRRVGEPFFTTKEPGKGMGLGVFLVRTLAARLGGRFDLQSEAGLGTTALFELPCLPAPVPSEANSLP